MKESFQANGSLKKTLKPRFWLRNLDRKGPLKTGGWWQLKHFSCSSRIPGEMIQFDEHIFQTG